MRATMALSRTFPAGRPAAPWPQPAGPGPVPPNDPPGRWRAGEGRPTDPDTCWITLPSRVLDKRYGHASRRALWTARVIVCCGVYPCHGQLIVETGGPRWLNLATEVRHAMAAFLFLYNPLIFQDQLMAEY